MAVFSRSGNEPDKAKLRNVSAEINSEFTDELKITDSDSIAWTKNPGLIQANLTALPITIINQLITQVINTSTTVGIGTFNYHNGFVLYDTFMHLHQTVGVTSDVVGGDTWWSLIRNVGGGQITGQGPELDGSNQDPVNRCGFAEITFGNGATDDVALYKGGDGSVITGGCLNAGKNHGLVIFEWSVYIPVLSDGTNRYSLSLGLANTPKPGNVGVYFRYSDNVNSGKWFLRQQDGSGDTTETDSGVTVAASTWYNLRAEIDAVGGATSIRWYINGTLVATVGTSFPGSANITSNTRMSPFVRCLKTLGTTLTSLYIDYFYCSKKFATPLS